MRASAAAAATAPSPTASNEAGRWAPGGRRHSLEFLDKALNPSHTDARHRESKATLPPEQQRLQNETQRDNEPD